MSTICPHIASIQLTRPTGSNHGTRTASIGGTWVHLRMCQSCGRTHAAQPAPSTQTQDRLAIKLNAERPIRAPIERPTGGRTTPSTAPGLKERRVISAWRR